jgi:hypothetical protein
MQGPPETPCKKQFAPRLEFNPSLKSATKAGFKNWHAFGWSMARKNAARVEPQKPNERNAL